MSTNDIIIGRLRDFISDCPHLQDGRVNVDYKGAKPTTYSIDGTPIKSIIKQYIDGSSIRQFAFSFGSVEHYGFDVLQNMENNGFYEDFAAWLEAQTRAGVLPDLGEGRQAQSVEAESQAYLYDNGDSTARYQVQCRLIYFQEN